MTPPPAPPARRRGGRPLRFLAMTLGGWSATRAALLWQAAIVATGTVLGPVPPPAPAGARPADRPILAPSTIAARGGTSATIAGRASPGPAPTATPPLVALALAALVRYGAAVATGPVSPAPGAIAPPLRATPIARGRSRLAGSAWAITRGGSGGTLLGGRLGASQAGARLTYALGSARRIALSARVASPLHGTGKEAAFGFDWQPTRMPLHVVAEQRVSLDGGRGGPTLMLVGGIDPTPVVAGFRLEAYAQAGAIRRAGGEVEAFGDGAARLTHRIAAIGAATVDLGAGAWGAAQRGARRLDVGPTLGAAVPVAGKTLRMTLDWRDRIGGDARPGSGPALSIGTDF